MRGAAPVDRSATSLTRSSRERFRSRSKNVGIARSIASPPEIPSQFTLIGADERIALVDRRDHVTRWLGDPVDDERLGVRLERSRARG